ncbi:unnamed protein product, partial [marine sediment metagenome]
QDRMHVLLIMRANIIGPAYEFTYTHSVLEPMTKKELCGLKIEHKIDLSKDIVCKTVPEEYEPHIWIQLPSLKKHLRLNIPNYNYIKESRALYQQKMGVAVEDLETEDAVIFWMSLYFSGVEDHRFQDVAESQEFLFKLGPEDAAAVANMVEYFRDWGPEMTIEGECPKCKEVGRDLEIRRYRFQLPLLDSFFFDKDRFTFDLRSAIKPKSTP